MNAFLILIVLASITSKAQEGPRIRGTAALIVTASGKKPLLVLLQFRKGKVHRRTVNLPGGAADLRVQVFDRGRQVLLSRLVGGEDAGFWVVDTVSGQMQAPRVPGTIKSVQTTYTEAQLFVVTTVGDKTEYGVTGRDRPYRVLWIDPLNRPSARVSQRNGASIATLNGGEVTVRDIMGGAPRRVRTFDAKDVVSLSAVNGTEGAVCWRSGGGVYVRSIDRSFSFELPGIRPVTDSLFVAPLGQHVCVTSFNLAPADYQRGSVGSTGRDAFISVFNARTRARSTVLSWEDRPSGPMLYEVLGWHSTEDALVLVDRGTQSWLCSLSTRTKELRRVFRLEGFVSAGGWSPLLDGS